MVTVQPRKRQFSKYFEINVGSIGEGTFSDA
jgi:hypothetical protein